MKQLIRQYTYETNSSSTHTLSIVDKDEFEDFKQNKLFYYTTCDCFKSYKDISTLYEFKEEYPEAENETDESKIQEYVNDFINEYFDGDYSYGYRYDYLDYRGEIVYDKDGNEKVAFSVYIPG